MGIQVMSLALLDECFLFILTGLSSFTISDLGLLLGNVTKK